MEILTDKQFWAVCAIALAWGIMWVIVHQRIPYFRFMNRERTWMTVVSGCAGNLLVLFLACIFFDMDLRAWVLALAIFTFSAVPVGARAIYNEQVNERVRTENLEALIAKLGELLNAMAGGGDDATATGRGDDS